MAATTDPVHFFLDCFHSLRTAGADSDLLDHFCAPGSDFVYPSHLDSPSVAHLADLRATMLATDKLTDGITRLCESYYSHLEIYHILSETTPDPDDVFAAYIAALQLHDPDLSNAAVMSAVWKVFDARTDPDSLRKIKNLFAEHELEVDIGLDVNTLSSIRAIVADDVLYRDVLNYLQLTQSSNLSWPEVVEMIQSMILRRSPAVWPPLESLLESWRDTRGIHRRQSDKR
ncbi:hypothetical protein BJ742DRAFT_303750 [Cladochytrium replicatum]|nr:hypothetical protein BJ742DRAFT_303750 [Cladochytrium replicatum]